MSARPSGKMVKRWPSTSASRRLRAGRVATRPGRRLATAPMSIVPWWTGSREIVSLPQREARTWARLAPRYSRSPRTQVGQSARRAIRIFWTSGRHPSTTYRAPDGVSPRTRRRASPAEIAPTIADAALKMPAVSQVGKLPGGGAFGLKQRKHAVTGARIANAIPYVAMAPPYTNGTFDSIAASLIRKRVSRLSVPSTTTSTPFRISRTVAEWTSLETGSIWISEFTERRRSAAASAFGRSTSRSAYSSCRWRFVSSTTSRSTSRRCPTPARARRSDEMLPRAPNPTPTARAHEGLHDFDGPRANPGRREPPLMVPDGRVGSRLCPRARGPHRLAGHRRVLSRCDGANAATEPDGLIAATGKRPAGSRHREKTRLPSVFGSVVEVEFVLLGDRVPVLVPFLEDGVEEGADDLSELLNLRPEARQLLHHFLVGSGHSEPLTRAITG